MRFFLFIVSALALEKLPKLCVNCRYVLYDNSILSKCSLFPIIENTELVNGLKNEQKKYSKEEYYYCSTARAMDNLCGPKGKLYRP
jgi:hypothetical protein